MTVDEIRSRADWTAGQVRDARSAILNVADSLRSADRPEAGDSLGLLADGIERSRATIVIAGEFKSGKSRLVNALIGRNVLPVDPIRVSSVPVRFRHGEQLGYWAVDREGVRTTIGQATFEELTTNEQSGSGSPLELVVETPADLLASGIELVDTPPLSDGLASPSGAQVLGLVQGATCVLLATEATQDLGSSEVDFLQVCRGLGGPVVLAALTKIDLRHDWPRIQEADRRHLATEAGEGVVLPVSALVYEEGELFGDREAIDESRIEVLRWYLVATVITDELQRSARHALVGAIGVVDDVNAALIGELDLANDSTRQAEVEEAIIQRRGLMKSLAENVKPDVERAVRAFHDDVSAGLNEELRQLKRRAVDIIGQGDPARGWPGIRSQILREGNQMAARYFARYDELPKIVEDALARTRLSAAAIGLGVTPDIGQFQSQAVLDDLDARDRYRTSNAEIARTSIGGALTAFGAASIIGTTMLAAATLVVPLSLAAGVVGLGAALKTSVDRRGDADLQTGRRDASMVTDAYLSELETELRGHARRHRHEVTRWLDQALISERKRVAENLEAQISRLVEIQNLDATERAERGKEVRQLIEQIGRDRALLEKVLFTLARPELAPVRR